MVTLVAALREKSKELWLTLTEKEYRKQYSVA